MGAYIICGWRAAGAEFIVAGAIPLVAVLVHCTLSAIYPCDIQELEKELSKIYNVKDMGRWLFRNNYYKPALSTIRQQGSRCVVQPLCRWRGGVFVRVWRVSSQHLARNRTHSVVHILMLRATSR